VNGFGHRKVRSALATGHSDDASWLHRTASFKRTP
jgi:hypothetical protein